MIAGVPDSVCAHRVLVSGSLGLNGVYWAGDVPALGHAGQGDCR